MDKERAESLKVKQVDKSSDCEDVLDVVVHVAQDHSLAFGLRLLEHVKQDAQAAGCDVLEFLAFKHDVLAVALGNRLQGLFGFDSGCCVKRAD